MTRAPALFLFSLLSLAATGCHPALPTRAEKAESFAPYDGDRVLAAPIRDFLAARSGIILGALAPVSLTETADGFRTESPSPLFFGTAAVIAPDGYFLTAGHCLRGAQYVLYLDVQGRTRAGRPRVVFAGDRDRGDPDLAVLHVEHARCASFEWARVSDVSRGTPVIAIGMGASDSSDLTPAYSAGHALDAALPLEPPEGAPIEVAEILHDLPLAPGDSGGALVTRAGRLLGVNVQGSWLFGWRFIALRPRPSWIAEKIDRDRKTRAARKAELPR